MELHEGWGTEGIAGVGSLVPKG